MRPYITLVLLTVSFAMNAIPSFGLSFSPLPIDLPNVDFISPEGINDAEQIVGTFRLLDDGVTPTNEVRTHGFLLEGTTFTPIDVPESTTTFISDINNVGQIVGSFGDANGDIHGFVLTRMTFTTIDVPGARLTAVRGINDLGQMVGIFDDNATGKRRGFLFDGLQFSVIEFPEAVATTADDVNAIGKIVGTHVGGGHGFIAAGTTLTPFDVPSSYTTILTAINDGGQIAGIFDDATGVRRGFLFDGETVSTIDAPGSLFTEIYGMNNKGQLVGAFQDGRRFLGFIATPQSEPMTLPIALVIASDEQAPNVAANTLDGDLDTRWSAQGEGAWIRYELERCDTVSLVRVGWYRGDERVASFDIETSIDGVSWTHAHSGGSSGGTLALQTIDLMDHFACFVRIVGFGNSINDWDSITEVEWRGTEEAAAGSM